MMMIEVSHNRSAVGWGFRVQMGEEGARKAAHRVAGAPSAAQPQLSVQEKRRARGSYEPLARARRPVVWNGGAGLHANHQRRTRLLRRGWIFGARWSFGSHGEHYGFTLTERTRRNDTKLCCPPCRRPCRGSTRRSSAVRDGCLSASPRSRAPGLKDMAHARVEWKKVEKMRLQHCFSASTKFKSSCG